MAAGLRKLDQAAFWPVIREFFWTGLEVIGNLFFCHPERSEGSQPPENQIFFGRLRLPQNDISKEYRKRNGRQVEASCLALPTISAG
jgi:hypothetical protein